MYSKSDNNFPLWKEKNKVQMQNNSCVPFHFFLFGHTKEIKNFIYARAWYSLWHVRQSATLHKLHSKRVSTLYPFGVLRPACMHWTHFLFLPWTWTEMCSSRATGWFRASCDLRFLFLWLKPLISRFARSSLKLIIAVAFALLDLCDRLIQEWNYYKLKD